ncbi:hypothetical protein DFH27DRAFT_599887 [Peziza echinospora]|nr:hypothetical protein DFH27DRAFT_599887 [Peziza echinospora]
MLPQFIHFRGYQTPSEDGDEKYSSWMRRSGRSKSVPMEVLNPWPTALATLKKPFQPSPPTASEELASPAHQNEQLPTNKQPSEFFMDFYSAGDKVFLSDDEDYGEPNDWGNGTSGFPTTSRELTNGFSTSRGGNNSIFNYGSTYGKTNGETTVLQLTAREEQMISAAWKKLLLKKVTRKLKAMEPSGPPKLLTKEERAAKIRAEFSNLMDETILEDDVKAGLENEAAEAWMENEAANVWIGLEEQEAWRDLEEQVAGSEYERRGIPRGAARGPSIRRPKTPQKHFYYSSEDEEEEYDRRVEEQRMKGN